MWLPAQYMLCWAMLCISTVHCIICASDTWEGSPDLLDIVHLALTAPFCSPVIASRYDFAELRELLACYLWMFSSRTPTLSLRSNTSLLNIINRVVLVLAISLSTMRQGPTAILCISCAITLADVQLSSCLIFL